MIGGLVIGDWKLQPPALRLRRVKLPTSPGVAQKSVFNLKKPPEVLENFEGLCFYFFECVERLCNLQFTIYDLRFTINTIRKRHDPPLLRIVLIVNRKS